MGHRMHSSRTARVASIISQLSFIFRSYRIFSISSLPTSNFCFLMSFHPWSWPRPLHKARRHKLETLHACTGLGTVMSKRMVHCILRDKNESTAQGDISEFLQLLERFSFLSMYSRSRCLASKITTLKLRSKKIHLSTQQPLQEQQQSHLHLRVPGPS